MLIYHECQMILFGLSNAVLEPNIAWICLTLILCESIWLLGILLIFLHIPDTVLALILDDFISLCVLSTLILLLMLDKKLVAQLVQLIQCRHYQKGVRTFVECEEIVVPVSYVSFELKLL